MGFNLRTSAVAVAGALMMATAATAMADSTNDLVSALVSKGVLTEEEGALLTRGHITELESQKIKEKTYSTNKVNIRGYVQVRNTTMLGGDEGINLWPDRSVGDDRSNGDQDKNFLIRRARVILFGDMGDRLSYYIQPDFASAATGAGNIAQLRDAYGDIYITKNREHRLRVGQSKVPFGFENMQSSQNRLAMDRADALNSAVRDERDLGVFYYYTPVATQEMFKDIMKQGLKHSGNYGQFGFGAYNGQGANQRERNDNYHIVARYTHPWKTETGQYFEAGIQGYTGNYIPVSTGEYRGRVGDTLQRINTSTLENRNGIKDERVALSFIMYPQPFGIQAEWNWGTTPGLDLATNTIKEQSLHGGYVQLMHQIDNFKFLETNGRLISFARWQYFDGFNKAESNAARNDVNDLEVGFEWQIAPEVELVAYYHKMKRSNLVTNNGSANRFFPDRADYERFDADALRVQMQYNF